MRFSDLKKKFPSLRVSVLVIAAFALLGLMMIPSIAEKMGLDEGFCLASPSADGAYDYYDYQDEECLNSNRDYMEEQYDECVAEVELSACEWFGGGIEEMYNRSDFDDDEAYDEAIAYAEKAFDFMYNAALEMCEEMYSTD